ncbi:MAG: ABC transporter permease [Pseudomonadota bacterium]
MTAFIALIRKDLILFLSDRRALLVNLLLPILIATFFGYLFGGSGQARTGRIEVALVLADSSAVGQRIGAGLRAEASLALTVMTLEQAQDAVRKGKQKAAIVIPAGFGEAAGAALFGAGAKPEIEVLYDPSQQAVLAMVKGMLTQQVMQVVSAEMFGASAGQRLTDQSLAALEARAASDPDSAALRDLLVTLKRYQARPAAQPGAGAAPAGLAMPFVTRDAQVRSATDAAAKGYNGYAHAFAGMGVQFILFMGVNMGIEILLARRSGIWSRLLAAPLTMRTVLLARAVSAALIAFGLMLVIFMASVLLFEVQIANPAGFLGVVACFALLTASFGLLIAALGKTPEAARGIATFATLIMVMLGGAWVPSFMFPQWVQSVTLAVPTRWAIDGLDAMTWRALGLEAAWPPMLVMLGFTAVFGTLALWKFTREQR